MSQWQDSAQHRRRLVDEWPIEAAYRKFCAMAARAIQALQAESRAVRESEWRNTAMVGGTGGPRYPGPDDNGDNGNGGMRTETCSICDGSGRGYVLGTPFAYGCRTCGGTGRITYRSAAKAEADAQADAAAGQAQRDKTLDFVRRYRASQQFTPDEAARLRVLRSLYEAGHYAEDR